MKQISEFLRKTSLRVQCFDFLHLGRSTTFNQHLTNWLRCLSSESALVINTDSLSSTEAPKQALLTKSTDCTNPSTKFRQIVANRFREEPYFATQELVAELGEKERHQLLLALHDASKTISDTTKDEDSIFASVDRKHPVGLLDRTEFAQAIKIHKIQEKQKELHKARLPVSTSDLITLALATSVPYFGFGFLDNFIMISAGESIEHAFGLSLGLSMMAAAAWGNMVSDVAGVCMQETIEQKSRNLRTLVPPKLSKFQSSTFTVRMAKLFGAIVGVCIGCMMGMIPLLFFDSQPPKESTKQHKEASV